MDFDNQICLPDQTQATQEVLMSNPGPLECVSPSPAASSHGTASAPADHSNNPLLASIEPVGESVAHFDAAKLGQIAGKVHDGPAPTHPPTDELELCKRPAEIPVLKQTGIQHWWLRNKNIETGMGKRGAGVPGQPGGSAYTLSTTLNDHKGQGEAAGSTCEPVGQADPRWANEDPGCIAAETKLGTPTGPWLPPFNDCHEVVKDILDDCRIPGLPGAPVPAMGSFEPTDGGISDPPDGGVIENN
jgi:hypothetical protein